jgi:hypothetical protein
MNKQIKELAKQAGINSPDGFKLTVNHMATFRLEKFAELVAAHEREECAKICDHMDSISDYYTLRVELICAQAIRARGTT